MCLWEAKQKIRSIVSLYLDRNKLVTGIYMVGMFPSRIVLFPLLVVCFPQVQNENDRFDFQFFFELLLTRHPATKSQNSVHTYFTYSTQAKTQQ